MADIKISELGAASAVNSTDIFPMTSSGVTVKATAQQIKNYMGVGNIADLNTTDKSSAVAAINEVDAHADTAQTSANIVQAQVSNSGDAYSPSRPYKVGELCIYNNVLYRCTTACSAGSWTANQSCFTPDTLTNALSSVNKFLSNEIIIKEVSSSSVPLPSTEKADLYYTCNELQTHDLISCMPRELDNVRCVIRAVYQSTVGEYRVYIRLANPTETSITINPRFTLVFAKRY